MRTLEALQQTSLALPVVDAASYMMALSRRENVGRERAKLGEILRDVCHSTGMFYLTGHGIEPGILDGFMDECNQLFDLPQECKDAISIHNSPHFRGYGLLKNHRDWREQIHLGMESSHARRAACGEDIESNFWGLEGENQWPLKRTLEFKNSAENYIASVNALSRVILEAIAHGLGLPEDYFTTRMKDRPYLLLKAMAYHPQLSPIQPVPESLNDSDAGSQIHDQRKPVQMGVTAHCDWSWLTFLIQDSVGGLEAMDRNGQWHRVNPLAGAFVVNTGELLEIETCGYLRASPHRVINERIDRKRISIATFINPALDSIIVPACQDRHQLAKIRNDELSTHPTSHQIRPLLEHVHKVIEPGAQLSPFLFGNSEWSRKACGKWCYLEECIR